MIPVAARLWVHWHIYFKLCMALGCRNATFTPCWSVPGALAVARIPVGWKIASSKWRQIHPQLTCWSHRSCGLESHQPLYRLGVAPGLKLNFGWGLSQERSPSIERVKAAIEDRMALQLDTPPFRSLSVLHRSKPSGLLRRHHQIGLSGVLLSALLLLHWLGRYLACPSTVGKLRRRVGESALYENRLQQRRYPRFLTMKTLGMTGLQYFYPLKNLTMNFCVFRSL